MGWIVRFTDRARKELKKLDRAAQVRITAYLEGNVAGEQSPRRMGAALQGSLSGYWKYRVGDYRLVCSIEDERVLVLVLRVGHRREIYRDTNL